MKKTITILGAVLFASLIQTSCGDKGKEKGNSSDAKVASSATGLTESEFTDILAEMKSEGEMDEKFITKIKSKIAVYVVKPICTFKHKQLRTFSF